MNPISKLNEDCKSEQERLVPNSSQVAMSNFQKNWGKGEKSMS